MNDRDARLNALLDRQEIYDVLMRYVRGTDRLDQDLMNSVYHEDAKVTYGRFSAAGTDVIPDLVHSNHEGAKRLTQMHGLMGHSVRIDGDVANSETYFVRWAIMDGSPQILSENGGRYLDRFERRNGEWRIAERVVIWEWKRSTDLPVTYDQIAGITRSFRSKEDASYTFLALGERRHLTGRLELA